MIASEYNIVAQLLSPNFQQNLDFSLPFQALIQAVLVMSIF